MKYSITQEMVDWFRSIAKGGPVEDITSGLCTNFDRFRFFDGGCCSLHLVMEVNEIVFSDLEGYSGNPCFPVAHPDRNPCSGYFRCPNLYVGEYGNNRRALAGWLADKMEAKLKEAQ